MRTKALGWVGGIAGLMLGGLVAAGGCMGADEPAATESEGALHGGARIHRPHRTPDAGSTGSTGSTTADSGVAADCDVCTQAAQCCSVVESGRPGCASYSAATCASMSDDARPYFVNACLTYVVSVRGVWAGNAPAACR